MELFGNPPVFPADEPEKKDELPEDLAAPAPAVEETTKMKADPLKFTAKKAKVQQKAAGGKKTYQWNIMKSIGLEDSEIARFADAYEWLEYFPQHCIDDLNLLGTGIDWRRKFITTDKNPFYDSFVRWQFETLRERGKIQFGKRYTIWSPIDGQPCADHDRASGEGVVPQDYTLIKMEVVSPYPSVLSSLQDKKVYLVPGTLRPETMYGQTNCWILPDGDYGAFQINATDVFICTEKAALNLAYQNLSLEERKVTKLLELKGSDLLGVAVKAPLSKYPVVHVLPMLSILINKGTGIVTSVPSDSPDDFMSLQELKKKPAFRAKFNLKDEQVMPFEPVPIIDVPELGDICAKSACEKFKVNSPGDKENLAKAKDECYLNGFAKGIMLVGNYAGQPVKDAKPLIRDQLLADGLAAKYSEPTDTVISRSGDECVVCLTDQWFVDYGEDSWKESTRTLLKNLNTYTEDSQKKFDAALEWLNQWACSRTYGLGTKLPWDPQYLIESLSDSTIYMAYYTVSHLLQGGDINGASIGPLGIEPQQLTKAVWDYIFLSKEYPSGCGIPQANLDKLRKEFDYWYPVDIRVSGKELINNHLTFSLYNHTAIWPNQPEKWPVSMRANGHVLLNGKKMSKSEGNFMTLVDAVGRFGADGTRFALADSGDSLDDANFTDGTADNAILRLFTEKQWVEQTIASINSFREGPPSTFLDRVFESQIARSIQETEQHYESTNFREAVRTGFFDMQTHRDNYRDYFKSAGSSELPNKQLLLRFIEVQAILLAPITPHFSEYVWGLLGKSGSVRFAKWPEAGNVDSIVLLQYTYLQDLCHNVRNKKDYHMKPKGKKGQAPVAVPPPTKLTLSVAKNYPPWMTKTIGAVRAAIENGQNTNEITKLLTADADLKKLIAKAMPFVAKLKSDFAAKGQSAFNLEYPFDEKKFLVDNAEYLKSKIPIPDVEVSESDDERANPGEPHIVFA
eukprot:TRINITY_DN1582_c0_g1_i1.p1 TRINITY_DN1582_c0_g1~~TRINITY_DN1582_c0_g1_i1.p1  ORF type:complete len:1097 (-),score=402.52 TRINITY_DN1582_c0_g1_i1:38-2932(-)